MQAIFSGIGVAIVAGIIAAVALWGIQQPVYQIFSSSSTRLGDPGSNLVGENWSGNPQVR